MHHYPFHLGDYIRKTAHLSVEEDCAYRRLLDYYYETEAPIPTDVQSTARKIRINATTVQIILEEFFKLEEDGWHQRHCDEVIATYHLMAEGGKRGAQVRWGKGKDSPPNSPPINTPLGVRIATNNHKPITNNHSKYIPPINGELLADWLEVRKAKRAGKLTETAFKGLQREARLAGLSDEQAVQVCCERGWQGFKAEWYLKKPSSQTVQEARLDFVNQVFGGKNGTQRSIKDITPGRTIEGGREGIPEVVPGIRKPDGG